MFQLTHVLHMFLEYSGFKAEALADHLRSTTELPFKFSRPIDKIKAITTGLALGIFILVSVFAWPLVLKMASFTHIWSAGTMVRSSFCNFKIIYRQKLRFVPLFHSSSFLL